MNNGFSGADFVLRDYEDDSCHQTSILVSTAKDTTKDLTSLPITLFVVKDGSMVQKNVAERLESTLVTNSGSRSHIISVDEAASYPNLDKYLVVFLLELKRPFLQFLDKISYLALKSILIAASNVLWITGGGGPSGGNPGFGIIDGFSRALRLELNNLKLVTLALENTQGFQDRGIETIVQVIRKSSIEACGQSYEREYTEIDGMLHVKRIVEANDLKLSISEKLASRRSTVQRLQDSEPLKLDISTIGQLETLGYLADESAQDELQADEVEIQVKAVGLNTVDYLMAEGKELKTGFGSECAGIINRAGKDSDVQSGDRVCMFAKDVFKTYARSTQDLLAKIPDEFTFEQASILPRGYLIAFYLIHEVARLKKNESVLIHDASGSIGEAAIHLAQSIGANVYATACTKEDRQKLINLHNLPADHIFSIRSFMVRMNETTKERGVDVIINPKSSQEYLDSLSCIGSFGRFIQTKQFHGSSSRAIPVHNIPFNVTFTTVDPESVLRNHASLIRMPLQSIIDFAAIKTSQTEIFTHKAFEVEKAFEKLRGFKEKGRVVVCMNENDKVAVSLIT